MFEPVTYWTSEFGQIRAVSRVSSQEISVISAFEPRIFDEERGYLCAQSPINFVGSILAKCLEPELKEIYTARHLKVPKSLQRPIEYLEGPIQLKFWHKDERRYINLTDYFGAECRSHVLVKHACGEKAALILRGPLAGLISSVHMSKGKRTYCINRVWNDKDLVQSKPYDFTIRPEENVSVVDFVAQEKLNAAYYGLISEHPTAASAMFYLLDQLDIKVNENDFHMTRFTTMRT